MCEFTKLMKGTKYEKKDPELTYELMVQLAAVKEATVFTTDKDGYVYVDIIKDKE